MSKRRKNRQIESAPNEPHLTSAGLAAEYRFIRLDLIRLLVWNVVLLAAVLTVYYTNLHSHYLETWFSKIFHF